MLDGDLQEHKQVEQIMVRRLTELTLLWLTTFALLFIIRKRRLDGVPAPDDSSFKITDTMKYFY